MENNTSVLSLLLVVSIAFSIPLLLHKLKLQVIPVVVAEIIAGFVIGKSGFQLVAEDLWLELLSLLGFIYLMFLSGMEINFNSLFLSSEQQKKSRYKPLIIAAVIFFLILAISYFLSLLLYKLGLIAYPFLMVIIISTISLGVVLPVLKEKKLTETNLGQIILLVTAFADLSSMLLLTVFIMTRSQNNKSTFLILLFFIIIFIFYYLIKKFSSQIKLLKKFSKSTVQIGTRAVFFLILLFVGLSEIVGLESILGAFLAGTIVSILSPNKDFVHRLDSFGFGFLIPIFFVMVGARIDLWGLFQEPRVFYLVPLIFLFMYLAKIIPSLILKIWHTWQETLGVGIILSCKLSLVIAASAVALEYNLISVPLNDALILVSVMTCLISPVTFSHIFPKVETKKTRISIVGANTITLPASTELARDNYDVTIFGSPRDKLDPQYSPAPEIFPLVELDPVNYENLKKHNAFDTDVIILATNYDNLNTELAYKAQKLGIKHIILRLENLELHKKLAKEGFIIFSSIFASRILLKALVEQPGLVRLITQDVDSFMEIEMKNPMYDNYSLRHLPFLGDALVLRIYREDSSIVPHGDTKVRLGDILLISGNKESLQATRKELG